MKKLIPCMIAAGLFVGGCATEPQSSSDSGAMKAGKEDYVTGSRLPRSESNENYQGAKAISSKDYNDYLGTLGKKSN